VRDGYKMIKKALEGGVSLDLWSFILIVVLAFLAGLFVSYLRTKAKNLATKKDDKPLESYSEEYHLSQQPEVRKHQLSIAALDKRLAAHQEAHALWTELIASAELKEKADPIVMKCENWWNNNSPYLTPEVRDAFRSAYLAAFRHPDLLVQEDRDWEEIKDNFETIRKAGDVIFKAVFLPGWGEEENKPIDETEENN
jgi:hypothetical protein